MWSDGPAFEQHLADPWAPHPVANRLVCSMGGGGGGGQQPQQSTQVTKSSNEPPAFIQPYLQAGIQDLTSLYNNQKTAPEYYPKNTVAPQSEYTKQAIAGLVDFGRDGSPYIGAGSGMLTDTLNGKYLDPTSNPQYLKAIEASHKPFIEQFTNQIMPGITSTFAGAGRDGSGLHRAMVDQAVGTLGRTISDADAKAGADYFTRARDQQIKAAGLIPQMAQTDLAKINATGEAGDITNAYDQAKINEDIARYNYDNNKQWDYIARYLGIVNGGYPGGEYSGNSYGTSYMPQQGGGGFGSFLGPAMQLASLGMQGAMLFSDERLKEDIAPVGALNDGQTVFSYRYVGDPTPRIGLLAQEVEKRHPEAVHTDPETGFKKVHYGLATSQARGLI